MFSCFLIFNSQFQISIFNYSSTPTLWRSVEHNVFALLLFQTLALPQFRTLELPLSLRHFGEPLCRNQYNHFSHEDTKAQRNPFLHFGQSLCRRCHQSRAVLPKPPHEPVSAKLAYLKLRLLTLLRVFRDPLSMLLFCLTALTFNLSSLSPLKLNWF